MQQSHMAHERRIRHARRATPLLLVLLALAGSSSEAAAVAGGPQPGVDGRPTTFPRQAPSFAPKRLLVKLKTPAAPTAGGGGAGIASSAGAAVARLPGLELRASFGGSGSGGGGGGGSGAQRRLLAAAQVAAVGSGSAVGLFAIRDGMSVTAKLAQLKGMPAVAWASPDRLLYPQVLPAEHPAGTAGTAAGAAGLANVSGSDAAGAAQCGSEGRRRLAGQGGAAGVGAGAASGAEAEYVPNDPDWLSLWHLPAVDATHAWPYGKGSTAAKLCIIDTGMQRGHPDLPTPLEGWNGVPVVDEGGSFVSFPQEGDADFRDWDDGQEHGTHVAGIAAALGGNGIGVTGLAWQAGLQVCRVFNSSSTGAYLSAIYRCAELCVQGGAKVVSMSLGGAGNDEAYEEVARLLQKADALWVVPAGNDALTFDLQDSTNWFFPAGLAAPRFGHDNVIAVASIARDGLLSSFSNRGAHVMQLAAPGTYILSTLPLAIGGYGRLSGTSMATPLVAAAAAQLAAAYHARFGSLPSYTELKRVLLATTDPFPDGALYVSSGGTLNVARAMRLLLFNETTPPKPAPGQGPAPQALQQYLSTLVKFPGVRWFHYTESATLFLPLAGQTYEQCTQTCITNLLCGKYVFWRPPATTNIGGVLYNCLLWDADAEWAREENNTSVESGLVKRTLIIRPPPPTKPSLPPPLTGQMGKPPPPPPRSPILRPPPPPPPLPSPRPPPRPRPPPSPQPPRPPKRRPHPRPPKRRGRPRPPQRRRRPKRFTV